METLPAVDDRRAVSSDGAQVIRRLSALAKRQAAADTSARWGAPVKRLTIPGPTANVDGLSKAASSRFLGVAATKKTRRLFRSSNKVTRYTLNAAGCANPSRSRFGHRGLMRLCPRCDQTSTSADTSNSLGTLFCDFPSSSKATFAGVGVSFLFKIVIYV